MKKVTFLKLLSLISNVGKDTEKLEELGIDVCERTLVNGMCELFDTVMEDAYGQGGLEWVQWWVYEKSRNPEPTIEPTQDLLDHKHLRLMSMATMLK